MDDRERRDPAGGGMPRDAGMAGRREGGDERERGEARMGGATRAAATTGGGAVPGAPGDAYDPETARLGLWAFLATEVLLFGGLFTAYIVFRLRYPRMFHDDHMKLDRVLGAVNTVVLICSSLTVALGTAAIREGKRRRLQVFLSITILLAAVFLGIKYVEWTEKFARGLYPRTDIFFSLYFTMTGLHGLHVFAGMVILAAMAVLAGRGAFSGAYHTPVEVSGLYWHFVDLVWIYLFPLFYLIG